MLGTTPRRVTLGVGTASALALIGNFVGITDSLLSTNPQISRSLKLDQLYAVGGLRGYYTSEYVVLYPKNWLFDQSVAQAQAYRKEAESRFARPRFEDGVDDLLLARKSDRNLIPDAAFGPPKGGKYENLSVVKQKVGKVPSIQVLLGEPEQALERLLSTTIAPEGSGKKAKIIAANKRPGGEEAYDFEYILTLPNQMQIHTWSVAALKQPPMRSNQPPTFGTTSSSLPSSSSSSSSSSLSSSSSSSAELFTMTFVAPEKSCDESKVNTAKIITSEFHVF